MEKVAVIGSNSFSGSHFIDFLLDKTKYAAIGMSRSPEKKDIYLPYKRGSLSEFEFHQLDLNKDMGRILDILDKEEPPYIVNFASQSMVGQSWEHPEHWYRTNVLSTVELINSLKERKYLKKYVHISTPEVYGSCSGMVKEDFPFHPSTPYAASRAAADTFIQLMVKTFNFPAVFTRAANVYGPGQQFFKIIPRSIVYIKKGIKIPLHGGGEARRAFIHMDDVSSATLNIMEKAKPGEVYHLSTNNLISVRDIVGMICKKMKVGFDSAVENVPTRLGLDDAYILDSSKAKKEFKWEPKIEIDKGLDEVIGWVNDNWNVISSEPLEYIHKA
ncbi:GDP-mannose 4,6-dehydratase [Candidatus Woesearchaeota archaeon]|nr:GDP-mannose 4,6-dehydratase [Candidatus Woesearchaeota archaeon]